MQSGNFTELSKVCKCGILCVKFLSVAVYNSAVMEFWPLHHEQRIKLFLIPADFISEVKIDKKFFKEGHF